MIGGRVYYFKLMSVLHLLHYWFIYHGIYYLLWHIHTYTHTRTHKFGANRKRNWILMFTVFTRVWLKPHSENLSLWGSQNWLTYFLIRKFVTMKCKTEKCTEHIGKLLRKQCANSISHTLHNDLNWTCFIKHPWGWINNHEIQFRIELRPTENR